MQYFKKAKNKLTRKFTVTLITLATLLLSGAAEASLVVIANPRLPVKKLTAHQLGAIYLDQPVSIKANITPYNQPSGSHTFSQFYRKTLEWGPDQVSGYWAKQVFSGAAQQPATVASDQAAIKLVEQNPTAIAYVNSSALTNVGHRVKIVYGHYKIPVRKALPHKDNDSYKLYSSTSNNGYMTALSEPDPVANASNNTNGFASNPDMELAQQLTAINNINESQPSQNIWNLIASHMTLQNYDNNPNVRHWIVWFQQHPKTLNTIVNNAVPYLYYVYQQTRRRHMPAEFALLPMIESGYNPRAYSSAGAAGLWQLMPGTASGYGMAIDWWYDSRRDILTSTKAGLNYLVRLHHMTHTWFLAAAAYNVGPGALESAIRGNRAVGKQTDFWNLKNLPAQTENYVPKLLAISAIIANPHRYGIKLPYIPDRPFFGSVTLTSQMDLQEISKFSGVSIPVIKALNPGLQRWATAPRGKFTLLLPVMSVNTFERHLDEVIGQSHVAWKYHLITPGETLQAIAAKQHTTMTELEKVNQLHSTQLKAGEGILVPVADGARYTKLASVNGTVKSMRNEQQQLLSSALSRAVQSQAKALPAEVTGEPIKADDDLKSLLGKLYGN